jgi:hypothetical protein
MGCHILKVIFSSIKMQHEDRFYYLVIYVNQEDPIVGQQGSKNGQFLVSKLGLFKNGDNTIDFRLNLYRLS